MESALPINVVAGDELKFKQASTLGETLKNEVGVHSTAYGAGSSSPIIRGFDGPRVLISQNGLDAGDVSRVGADHAISSDSSTAEQIEVLRGPATLFYGSGAIGGVVNVVDHRVPHDSDFAAEWLAQYSSVAEEPMVSGSLKWGGDKVAFHIDGFWRDAENYELAGPAEIDLHDDHDEEEHDYDEEHHEHDEHDEAVSSRYLENSFAQSSGFTFGTSLLLDQGFIGVSFGRIDREYGIPGHVHHGEHGEHEEHDDHDEAEHADHAGVYADMEQDKIQLISELDLNSGFVKGLNTKISYTDYHHAEIDDGAIGTTFESTLFESRFDVLMHTQSDWKGALSLHVKDRSFEAVGAEAFTPASDTRMLAISLLEEKHFDDYLVQFGARIERVTLETNEVSDLFHGGHGHDDHEDEHGHEDSHDNVSLDFTPVSLSAGVVYDYHDGYNVGVSMTYSQRAPSAAEVFAFGPHIGTNTYEIGSYFSLHGENDHDFHVDLATKEPELESSANIDLTWRKFEGDFGFVANVFYNQIDNYYFQQFTGYYSDSGHDHDEHDADDHDDTHADEHDEHDEHNDEEGLAVFAYQQSDVDIYGLEAELVYKVSDEFKTTVYGDYTRAKTSNGKNLPRIPPMRLGAVLDYQLEQLSLQLSANYFMKQDKLGYLETDTDGYTMIDLNANYYLNWGNQDVVLFAKVNNVTDTNARVHSSYLKNIAPLPGRNFTLGIRGSF